jgi:hypothetical protein
LCTRHAEKPTDSKQITHGSLYFCGKRLLERGPLGLSGVIACFLAWDASTPVILEI